MAQLQANTTKAIIIVAITFVIFCSVPNVLLAVLLKGNYSHSESLTLWHK